MRVLVENWDDLRRWVNDLRAGDPMALGLLGLVVLLALFTGVIYWIDRKAKQKETSKSQGGKRGR